VVSLTLQLAFFWALEILQKTVWTSKTIWRQWGRQYPCR